MEYWSEKFQNFKFICMDQLVMSIQGNFLSLILKFTLQKLILFTKSTSKVPFNGSAHLPLALWLSLPFTELIFLRILNIAINDHV